MVGNSQTQHKILIIEDNESSADILRLILEREGYRVEVAVDGYAGEHLIARTPAPDAVLLDVTLPYVDGFQLMQTIRRTAAWKHVPVIMLSGHANGSFIDHALRVGANKYFVKPFRRNELIQCMQRLLPRQAAV
jgi:DNA-binding response OmpR family regulator